MKVLLVCSSGGHLDQLLLLEDWLSAHDVAVATFLKPDSVDRVSHWRHYALHWPTNRNVANLIRNTLVAIRVMATERPDLVISSGAAGAVPFFYLAKCMPRCRTVFIECYDRIDLPTLTAKLVKPVTDLFVVQWSTQLPDWPRRADLGPSR
jgi:beta-1,4-N-acetylglucosaminyltransferase